MMNELIPKLKQLKDLLAEGGEAYYSTYIDKVLGSDEEDIWLFLCSNELWGGAGSIADQAVLENEALRKQIELLLIELGELQLKSGRVNVRTEMWVSAFRQWKEQGII
jgi:hypothetical protein